MGRHDLAREIVVGGTKTAGENQHPMPRQRVLDMRGELRAVVADDRFERHGDAEVVEHLGDVQRVGVGLVRRQQLAADGENGRGQAVSHAGTIHTHARSARCA